MKKILGSCLCGSVTFAISDSVEQFFFCHCTQCQKSTGSAFAANIFTDPDTIEWLTGIELIQRYDVDGRIISNVFCSACGSRVPYLSKSGKHLVIPAGVLNGSVSAMPNANIFWAEKASWYSEGQTTPHFPAFPE